MSKLDEVEKGYEQVRVKVQLDNGAMLDAQTYVSSSLTDDPTALDSYKQVILSGADETRLPPDYIHYLQQLPSRPGPGSH